MYEVRLKAPKDKSLMAEITSPIDVDTPELVQMGQQMSRIFVRADDKVTFHMKPGDDMDVGEFDPEYKSLKQLIEGEDAKRAAETRQVRSVGGAIMPEVAERFGEGDYAGERREKEAS